MSRRERISDFTRPTTRHQVGDSRRVITREQVTRMATQNPVVERPAEPVVAPLAQPTPVVRKVAPVTRTFVATRPAQPRQDKSSVLRRQGLKKLPPFKPRRTRNIHYRQLGITLGVVIVLAAIPLAINKVNKYRAVLGAKDTYKVSDDLPKYFSSSNMMNVAAKVRPISAIDDSADSVSDDGSLAGWYQYSSKPGQPGTTILAGDVSGREKIGVFENIKKLKVGSTVQIETGDGRILIYKVKAIRKYDTKSFNEQEVSQAFDKDRQALNLVTFYDRIHPDSEYGKYRYVVFAVKEDN